MRSPSVASALLALCAALSPLACGPGGPSSPAKAATTTVEVPSAREQPGTSETLASAEDARPPVAGLEACIAELRTARDVPAPDEERGAYDAALAAERRDDWSAARLAYFQLIQRWPSSKLVPLAYLAFGELFAAEAARDESKWELAKQAYLEVLKYPAPDNPAWHYALLRRGDALLSTDATGALEAYSRVLRAVAVEPESPCASGARDRARGGLIEAYASVGAADKAFPFLRATLGDADARAALRELIQALQKAGRAKEACEAARSVPNDPDLVQQTCR